MWPFSRSSRKEAAEPNTVETPAEEGNNENQNVANYKGKSQFNALHTGIIPNSFGTSKGEALACQDNNRTSSPSSSTSTVPAGNSSASSSQSSSLQGPSYSSPMDINPEGPTAGSGVYGTAEPHSFPPLPSSPTSSRRESMGSCSSPVESEEDDYPSPRRISERLWGDEVEEATSTPLDSSWQLVDHHRNEMDQDMNPGQSEDASGTNDTTQSDYDSGSNLGLRAREAGTSCGTHEAADSLLQHVRETEPGDKSSVDRASQIDSSVKEASQQESKHEIIHLTEQGMEVNYYNLHRFRDSAAGQKNTLVVSFLGDTSAGKSHTIRELMGENESRPFCQEAGPQNVATTFNVNLFPSTSLVDGITVNFVDYEGENGSDFPIMAAARMVRPSIQQTRHKAVVEHFPRLAYTTSDIVVVVCREPFYNRRYLERCVNFAKRANAGVTNVDRPALLLVGNKLPGEECEVDLDVSTNQFFESWGEDAKVLDSYFSTVICMYMPHRRSLWKKPSGGIVEGEEVFEEQVNKFKRILHVLAEKRAKREAVHSSGGLTSKGTEMDDQRLITQHQGLWFALLPRVVNELNCGRGVNVSSLIDRTWAQAMAQTAAEHEMEMDIFLSFLSYIRPRKSLSYSAPRLNEDVIMRFICFRDFSLEIAARIIACRVRTLEPGVVVDDKVREYATLMFERVLALLDEMTPCIACYDQSSKQCEPVERPEEPILCLQERRTHPAQYHRTSRRVKPSSEANLWTRIMSVLPFNDTWHGGFCPPKLPEVDIESLVSSVRCMVHQTDEEFLEELIKLQRKFSALYLKLGFVQINAPFNLRDSELEHVRYYVDDGTLKRFGEPIGYKGVSSHLNSGAGTEGDAIVRPSGLDESFTGPINRSISEEFNLVRATYAPSEMPYCIGCGRKCLSTMDEKAVGDTNAGSRNTGSSWLRRLLAVVGMLPSGAVSTDNGSGSNGVTTQNADSETIEDALSNIEQELAESSAEHSRGRTNNSEKSKQVCFSPDSGIPSFGSRDQGELKRGGLKPTASHDTPRQHALLALCPRCWMVVESTRK